jgi:hypothetical protein
MAGSGHGHDPRDGAMHDGYGDAVTIVLSRRCAEDLYYALVMALGGSAPYGEPMWAPGKGKGLDGKPKGPLPKSKA